jgi:LPXTG-motif cell wall-anchored protein
MLKKLIFTCLLIYTSTIGLATANAKAAEPIAQQIEASVQTGEYPVAEDRGATNETNADQPVSEQAAQKQSSSSTEENAADKVLATPAEDIQGAGNVSGQAKTNSENKMNEDNAEADKVPSMPVEDIQGAGNASGQTGTNSENKMNEDNAEADKAPSVPVEDSQGAGKTSDKKETMPENNSKQDQSANTQITQNQNVKGGETSDQNQTANGTVCQQQTILAAVSCQDNIAGFLDGHAAQSQTATIEAAQVQNVISSATVKSEQTQNTGVTSEQKLEVTGPAGEIQSPYQGTNIITNQAQSINVSLDAVLFQGQLAVVNHSQEQLLEASGAGENGQRQLTNVEGLQSQALSTPGPAKMEQTQTVEVRGSIVNTLMKNVESGVKVTSRNSIEVIKETTTTVIKFIQEIFVNNELVDRFTDDYSHEGSGPYLSHQKVQKQYDWGNLNVENLASAQYNEQLQEFETSMSSYLSLVFGMIGKEDWANPVPNENNEPPSVNNNGTTGTPPVPPTQDANGSSDGEKGHSDVPAPGNTVQEPIGKSETNVDNGQKVQTIAAPVSKNNAQMDAGKGYPLANTATNNYNLLALGIVLITTGLLYYTLRKKIHE